MRADAGFSPSLNFRVFQQYLRIPAGWSRREAAIAIAVVEISLEESITKAESRSQTTASRRHLPRRPPVREDILRLFEG
jgi:hypothetical protein